VGSSTWGRREFLLGAAGLLAGLGCRKSATKAPSTAPQGGVDMSSSRNGESITAAGVDPSGRWLATTCQRADVAEWPGRIVTWDVESGKQVAAVSGPHIGWSWGEDMLAWAPRGQRVAATVDTNGILVVERDREICRVSLDVTRDNPTHACFLDEGHLFVAAGPGTGAIVEIAPGSYFLGDDDGVREIVSGRYVPTTKVRQLAGEWMPRQMRWNASISAIVGDDLRTMCAIDPRTGKQRYATSLAEVLPRPTIGTVSLWSSDGRRLAIGAPAGVAVLDGESGRLLHVGPALDDVRGLAWGPGDRMAIWVASRVHLMIGERNILTLNQPCRRGVWSPSGDAFALLDGGGALQIVDVASGRTRRTIDTKATGYHVELAWTGERLVVVTPEGLVGFWSTSGQLVARHELGAS
jgi:WD40 repeat protein